MIWNGDVFTATKKKKKKQKQRKERMQNEATMLYLNQLIIDKCNNNR